MEASPHPLCQCHHFSPLQGAAAIGICRRTGIGRVRHLAVGQLWVQERLREEIVLHRALWSVPFLALLLVVGKRFGAAMRLLTDRRAMLTLLATAMLIGANWWIFIFAINSGQVLEVFK